MTALRDALRARILAIPGVTAGRSRMGGGQEAFFAGAREIAHWHPGDELDVRLGRKEWTRRRARLADDPRLHRRSASSDWVEVRFATDEDLALAESLVRAAAQQVPSLS